MVLKFTPTEIRFEVDPEFITPNYFFCIFLPVSLVLKVQYSELLFLRSTTILRSTNFIRGQDTKINNVPAKKE